MELTSAEKNLLLGISFNSADIESGNLNDDEQATLAEMRAVADYLKDKYPSHSFTITGCDPKSGTIKTYNEWFFCREGEENPSTYSAMAEAKDEALTIKDNFFGALVHEPMEKEVTKSLTDSDFPVINVNVGFWEHLGKEYGENITASDVLKSVVPAGNDIKIFLDGSKISGPPYDATVASIKLTLQKTGVTGDIYIVVLKDAESDPAKDRLFTRSFTLEQ